MTLGYSHKPGTTISIAMPTLCASVQVNAAQHTAPGLFVVTLDFHANQAPQYAVQYGAQAQVICSAMQHHLLQCC